MPTIQNKCIRFCLQLDSRKHIGIKEFEQINWLPVSKRLNQCICSNAFKFANENCPLYLHDLYKPYGQDQINTRSSVLKLKHPSRSTCSGQNTLSYLTPTIWNNLPTCLKLSNSLNGFKHSVKEYIFQETEKQRATYFCLIKQCVLHQHLFQIAVWYSEMFLLVKVLIQFLIFLSFWNWFNY